MCSNISSGICDKLSIPETDFLSDVGGDNDPGSTLNEQTDGPDPPYPDFTQIPAVCTAFIILYAIVFVVSMFGNAAVCFTVISNRKMQTVVNCYIVNLALCDLMVGSFVLPVKLLELTAPASWGALNDGLCTLMLYLQTVFVFASVLTLVATCIERWENVSFQLPYHVYVTSFFKIFNISDSKGIPKFSWKISFLSITFQVNFLGWMPVKHLLLQPKVTMWWTYNIHITWYWYVKPIRDVTNLRGISNMLFNPMYWTHPV